MNGLMTDANQPGVEKLVVTAMKSSWKTSSGLDFSDFKLSKVSPDFFFMVKGWNRSVCALAVLWACYQDQGMFEARLFLFFFHHPLPSPCKALPVDVKRHLAEKNTSNIPTVQHSKHTPKKHIVGIVSPGLSRPFMPLQCWRVRMTWSPRIEAHVWIVNNLFQITIVNLNLWFNLTNLFSHRSDFGEQPNPAGSQCLQLGVAAAVPGAKRHVCQGLREDFAGGVYWILMFENQTYTRISWILGLFENLLNLLPKKCHRFMNQWPALHRLIHWGELKAQQP